MALFCGGRGLNIIVSQRASGHVVLCAYCIQNIFLLIHSYKLLAICFIPVRKQAFDIRQDSEAATKNDLLNIKFPNIKSMG